MRWSDAHVGNIRQAPLEGQEAVNPEIKVPDEQNPLVEDEELEPAPTRRDVDPKAPKETAPTAHAVDARDKDAKDAPKDAPKASDKPAAAGSSR